ncbi:hypothetical protein TeGR_g9463, partial [Tetraparma gracilis]
PPHPRFLRPGAGAAIVGGVGVFVPPVLFNGYSTLNALLADTSPPPPLTALAYSLTKLLTTSFSLGAGLVGGQFAPSLFIGATAGTAFHGFFAPLADLSPANVYSVVGAAAALAAVFRAPAAASLLLLELTDGNVDILLPTAAAAVVAVRVREEVERNATPREERD